MQYSRRQFNATMLAAMGSMLTHRALAQSTPATPAAGVSGAGASGDTVSGGGVSGGAPPLLPPIPGPVVAIPLDAVKRKRLHALDDLHLNNAGGDPQANLDKLTDAMARLYQQTRDGAIEGGEIYFPTGTYAIQRPLRPLPDIAFTGEDADASILRNTCTEQPYWWTTATLVGGFDHPREGSIDRHTHFRPFAADPRQGDTHLLVRADDYHQVNLGDELKIMGATGSVEQKPWGEVRRPNHMVKVFVTGKRTRGSDRILEIDRPLPWDLPTTQDDFIWGDLRGVPAWCLNKEIFQSDLDYWCRPGQHGYDTYTRLGADWGRGWSSRRNYFKNICLWSDASNTILNGLFNDSLFANCVMKGKKAYYGNTGQYVQLNDCRMYFCDRAMELSYNCLYLSFKNLLLAYDPTLGDERTDTMGFFVVHERSYGFRVNGVKMQVAGRKMFPKNMFIKVVGDNHEFRNVDIQGADMSQSENGLIRICRQNEDAQPPAGVHFRNMKFDLGGHSFNQFVRIEQGASDVLFGGLQVQAAVGKQVCDLRDATCHDVTFADAAVPGALTMSAAVKNVQAARCDFSGGVTGKYASSVQVTAGQPDMARWA